MAKNTILTTEQSALRIRRIAFQIHESNTDVDEIVVAGIMSNGFKLAEEIAKVLTEISSLKPLTNGVPQCSVLGALLFSIYINDLPLSIKSECELFADDTTIHSNSPDLGALELAQQNSTNDLIRWSTLNHMVLHPQKNKYMLIITRQKKDKILCPNPAF